MNNLTNIESVDIILPNYNKGDFIEESINSIINQTYKDWHLYIIDDNSTDNSKNVINKFSDLGNVTIINLKKNKGPAFMDSDDSWKNNKLEKQINFMTNNNLTFTYTDYTPFFENNGIKKFKKRTYIQNYFNFNGFIKNSSINTSTMIIDRSILRANRFKKIELEDYLFKCKLFKSNATATKLGEDLAFYRIIEKSRSSKKLKNIYWLWYINKNYNKLSSFQNLISIICISINSLKKYGLK